MLDSLTYRGSIIKIIIATVPAKVLFKLWTKYSNGAHLAQVDEEGAGGSIHTIVGVAGVRAPHLFHPLKKDDFEMACHMAQSHLNTPLTTQYVLSLLNSGLWSPESGVK